MRWDREPGLGWHGSHRVGIFWIGLERALQNAPKGERGLEAKRLEVARRGVGGGRGCPSFCLSHPIPPVPSYPLGSEPLRASRFVCLPACPPARRALARLPLTLYGMGCELQPPKPPCAQSPRACIHRWMYIRHVTCRHNRLLNHQSAEFRVGRPSLSILGQTDNANGCDSRV